MPKSDFEFYKFPNLPSEFVRPQPASDPYHGLYHPREVGDLAIGLLADVVEEVAEQKPDVNVRRANSAETSGYFFNVASVGHKVVRQHATLKFPLAEDMSTFYSRQMREIAS